MGPLPQSSVRRFVTILRSDVQGSTSLGERHDPELMRRVLARYYDAARAACSHHGGRIEQIQGDAVVAVFEGHEDDAIRAVRAATDLRDRMARLNEELERDTGMRLPIRMSVDSGEVVSGPDGPGQLAGDVMNVVAHLEREAGPGEIVLGEATLRLVREAVDVEQLGPVVLKGKAAPVRAYRLLVVLPGVTRRAHLAVPTEDTARAHAMFRLGQWLLRQGAREEGDRWLQEASRLHPESWCIWRQGAAVNELGLASPPEFWTRVDALGDRRYYARVPMKGMP